MFEWFDTFFDALAHDVWEALVPGDASDAEAAWPADRGHLVTEIFRGRPGAGLTA